MRSVATDSGVDVRPRIARAGSLGSACVAANTTSDTSSSVSTPSSTRRRMKPVMPLLSLRIRVRGYSVAGAVVQVAARVGGERARRPVADQPNQIVL